MKKDSVAEKKTPKSPQKKQATKQVIGTAGRKKPGPSKSGDKKAEKGSKKKGKRKSHKSSATKKGRAHVDILGSSAMENALYICHNIQDLLFWRGYPWPFASKKTKKGKK